MREFRRWAGGLAFVGAAVGATPAAAQTQWEGWMTGTQEVPPNASSATGYSLLTLMNNALTVNVTWSNLLGGIPGAAHIHCCTAPGTNVGVAVGFPGFPATVSGTYVHTFNLLDPTIYSAGFLSNFGGGTAAGAAAALVNGLNAGRAYTNIHNGQFPGGEIRATLTATPEPATVALVGSGVLALAAFARRRRREG